MKRLLLSAIFMLGGCSTIERLAELQNPPVEKGYQQYQPDRKAQSLHFHVEKIVRQLLDTTNQFDIHQPIVVGTFLPSATLSKDQNHSIAPFGTQIQESVVTLLTQAGLNVVEFRLRKEAKISGDADQFLSRDSKDVGSNISADFIVVGHYIQQEDDLVVNARLVKVSNKTIVAAATDYIPMNTMWSHEKVKLKGEHLFRGEY